MRGRIRAWTRAALRDVLCCVAVFAWSIAGFTILVTGAAVTGSLLFLVVGVFVWIGFVHVLRWTTSVDRKLASWQRHERVPAAYRRPAARGFMAYLKTLPLDPQTWKDMAWLGVNSILGFAGRLAVTTVGGLAASYVSMPLWTGGLASQGGLGITPSRFLHRRNLGRGRHHGRDRAAAHSRRAAPGPLVVGNARRTRCSHAGRQRRPVMDRDTTRSGSPLVEEAQLNTTASAGFVPRAASRTRLSQTASRTTCVG